jgi:hypothetical protein
MPDILSYGPGAFPRHAAADATGSACRRVRNHIASLPTCIDIGMCLRRILKRIAAINERPENAGLGETCKIAHVLRLW